MILPLYLFFSLVSFVLLYLSIEKKKALIYPLLGFTISLILAFSSYQIETLACANDYNGITSLDVNSVCKPYYTKEVGISYLYYGLSGVFLIFLFATVLGYLRSF